MIEKELVIDKREYIIAFFVGFTCTLLCCLTVSLLITDLKWYEIIITSIFGGCSLLIWFRVDMSSEFVRAQKLALESFESRRPEVDMDPIFDLEEIHKAQRAIDRAEKKKRKTAK